MVTEAQVKTQMQDVTRLYNTQLLAAGTNSSNWVSNQNTLNGDLVGDFVVELTERVASSRARLAAVLDEWGDATVPLLRAYGQVLSVPETDEGSILTRIYDDWITNSKRISSRGFVFGSITAAGGNVGNGTIYRLNLDENLLVIENQHADAKVARCLADSMSGADRHEELFEVRGAAGARDGLKLAGSGARSQINALSARSSAPLVLNPSFSQTTPAVPSGVASTSTALTGITNWFSNSAWGAGAAGPATGNLAFSGNYNALSGVAGTDFYRDFPGDANPASVQGTATAWCLAQSLEANRSKFVPGVPYYLQIAWRRMGSGDGTLTLGIGNNTSGTTTKSAAVDITSISNNAWSTLQMALGSASWFKNFDSAALSLYVARTAGTTGSVAVDDILFAPFASFDGSWYAIVGGMTQFLRLDQFTWTDAEYNLPSSTAPYTAMFQYWLWRSYGRYLPACPVIPPTAPTLAVSATAGAITSGTHVAAVTFVDANGVESGPSPISGSISFDGTKKADFSAIPVYPNAAVVTKKLYLSHAGATSPLYYIGTSISNATTTATAVGVADGSLTVAAPAGVTLLDPT